MLLNGNNGQITLDGKAYTSKLGTYQKQLSPQEVHDLLEKLRKTEFFSLENQSASPDNPHRQTLYVQLGERDHAVSVQGDAPAAFEEIRHFFLAQMQADGWAIMAP